MSWQAVPNAALDYNPSEVMFPTFLQNPLILSMSSNSHFGFRINCPRSIQLHHEECLFYVLLHETSYVSKASAIPSYQSLLLSVVNWTTSPAMAALDLHTIRNGWRGAYDFDYRYKAKWASVTISWGRTFKSPFEVVPVIAALIKKMTLSRGRLSLGTLRLP